MCKARSLHLLGCTARALHLQLLSASLADVEAQASAVAAMKWRRMRIQMPAALSEPLPNFASPCSGGGSMALINGKLARSHSEQVHKGVVMRALNHNEAAHMSCLA